MKDEILEIASVLASLSSKNSRDAINIFKRNIISNNLNTARIVVDELVDYFKEIDDGSKKSKKRLDLSSKLYDQTMELYEQRN